MNDSFNVEIKQNSTHDNYAISYDINLGFNTFDNEWNAQVGDGVQFAQADDGKWRSVGRVVDCGGFPRGFEAFEFSQLVRGKDVLIAFDVVGVFQKRADGLEGGEEGLG